MDDLRRAFAAGDVESGAVLADALAERGYPVESQIAAMAHAESGAIYGYGNGNGNGYGNGDGYGDGDECGYRRETPDEVLRRVLLASHDPDCTGTAREVTDMLRDIRARNAAAPR